MVLMMSNQSILFASSSKNFALIIGVSLVALVLLIANPGYFNHDELQRFDYLTRHGFKDYLIQHVRFYVGDEFGTPLRPFSFLIQGGLAFFMESYPVLVHLFAVLVHATVACLLFAVLFRFGASESLSLTIALVFVVNPLSIIATGWTAALMDQWYVLFGLITLIYADRYVRNEQNSHLLFGIFICSTLAMLSKETAVVLPGLMVCIWLVKPDTLRTKRYWLALVVWATPIVLFMIYRLPALIASFGISTVSVYKASISNVPDNLMVYLAYPFLFTLTDAENWIFIKPLWIWSALVLHLCLVLCLVRLYGYKAFLIYCVLYLLFLAPVLLIPMKGAHYLYGSSLALSMGIAALLHQKWPGRLGYKLVGIAGLVLLLLHSFILQGFVYSLGTCMNRAMTSTAALYLSHGRPQAVDFQAEPGAPEHVLYRINAGREQIGAWFPVKLTVSQWGENPPKNALPLAMNHQCLVYTKQVLPR